MAFRVVVKGADITKPPLLDTEEAVVVEIHDKHGELVALLHKMFDSTLWGLTSVNDDDWESAKAVLGYNIGDADLDVRKKKDFFDL